MYNSTKNYHMFKFRPDNRAEIDKNHVRRLQQSIESRNLLQFRPIIVNESMEILDGQHRLEAAKLLNLEIFYKIEKDLQNQDIILLNINKNWTMGDFLNYYCKNNFPQYIKLEKFMKSHGITLKVALTLCNGRSDDMVHIYKTGKFVFENKVAEEVFIICNQTIQKIKKIKGYSYWTDSARFWNPLVKLISAEGFQEDRWFKNIEKLCDKMGPRATQKDYFKMVQDIYNYRTEKKIDLMEVY